MAAKIFILGSMVVCIGFLQAMHQDADLPRIASVDDVSLVYAEFLAKVNSQIPVTYALSHDKSLFHKFFYIQDTKKSEFFWLFSKLHEHTTRAKTEWKINLKVYSNFCQKAAYGCYLIGNFGNKICSLQEVQQEYQCLIEGLKKGWRIVERDINFSLIPEKSKEDELFFVRDALSNDLQEDCSLIQFLLNNLDLKNESDCFKVHDKKSKYANSVILYVSLQALNKCAHLLKFDGLVQYKKQQDIGKMKNFFEKNKLRDTQINF